MQEAKKYERIGILYDMRRRCVRKWRFSAKTARLQVVIPVAESVPDRCCSREALVIACAGYFRLHDYCFRRASASCDTCRWKCAQQVLCCEALVIACAGSPQLVIAAIFVGSRVSHAAYCLR